MVVTCTEEVLPSGWRALRLRNEQIEVTLLPEKGSEIYALRSIQHDLDLLWKAPWGLRPPPARLSSGADSAPAWLDHYGGGWQELFPNAGDACTVDGAPHPFHGEASVAPWQSEIVASPTSGEPEIRLALRLTRSPFGVEKRVWLEADRPALHLDEWITNHGAVPAPLMWGHHPAFGSPFLEQGCRLYLPAATYEADAVQSVPNTWVAPSARSAWPHAKRFGAETETVDLSRLPGPDAGIANLGYALDLEDGWFALANPRRQLGIALVWPRDVFSSVWVWQEFGGTRGYRWYGGVYVLGVEPHTSYPGHGLAAALERGTARWLQPGERLEATLLAVLYDHRDRDADVARVTPDGDVVFTAAASANQEA